MNSCRETFADKLLHCLVFSCLVLTVQIAVLPAAFAASPTTCTTAQLSHGSQSNPPDIVVMTGTCTVGAGEYYFHNINILNGGELKFSDTVTDFWAESILIQSGGTLSAGSPSEPIGTAGGKLTIHLWGPDQGGTAKGSGGNGGNGIPCLMSDGKDGFVTDPQCGIPTNIWNSNKMDMSNMNPASCTKVSQLSKGLLLPGNVDDCFYQYAPLVYDDKDPNAYFGYKVLALSYNGTLNLYGSRGAVYPAAVPSLPNYTGTSWVRLAQNIDPADSTKNTTVVLSSAVDWKPGDKIVVTTTDYLPGHSEQRTIADMGVSADRKTITVTAAFQYPHDGTEVDLKAKNVPDKVGPQDDPNLPDDNGRLVDMRAAVGLLSRSIRIVSGCDSAGQDFPAPGKTCAGPDGSSYYFGGHTIFRQGFKSLQIQGVEFYQLGQGGRIMHYPVHFHMARQTPQQQDPLSKLPVTFLKDNTVWDSMTRWYTLHATQGVYMARNVGYLSIGHGYYLEDATETDNTLYSNLGIFARGAVKNPQNPRNVPGILAGGYLNATTDPVPYTSDVDHPTVFWITNGWNDFEYNFAAGANTCGVCYWFQPAGNSGFSRLQAWEGYASEQKMFKNTCEREDKTRYTCDDYASGDSSPLKKFVGNTCTTAMESFLTISETNPCGGVVPSQEYMTAVPNSKIPPTPPKQTTLSTDADYYYPKIDPGGSRLATSCPATGDCNPLSNGAPTLKKCGAGQEDQCMVTVIDHFRTSFNWSQQNFSAVWLRPFWYLFSNSAITDIQTGGLTMVTGGDYTDSSVIPGYWGLTRDSVFIGQTQSGNYYASEAGPFNQESQKAQPQLVCAGNGGNALYCLNATEGIAMPLADFAVNQRFFNIYDGPAYQDSNAYVDITKTILSGCKQNDGAVCSGNPNYWMYGLSKGTPMDTTQPVGQQCYMPNAAIAWKQPNGFFYPPAFHDQNLYFSNVDVRHFVIEPLFKPADYLHPFVFDQKTAKERYCTWTFDMFNGAWTDIDRQTELSDDDGSLTGLISKQKQNNGTQEVISVNKDDFFNAPYQDIECESDINVGPLATSGGTAISSPYEYVTTVIYPSCAKDQCGTYQPTKQPLWNTDCANQGCYGVPLYRLDVTKKENTDQAKPFIIMAGAAIGQRDTLTANHGTYYIDTTVSAASQAQQLNPNPPAGRPLYDKYTTFLKNETYYTFLLYAKPTTVQKYEMFIGTGLDRKLITDGDTIVFAVQVDKSKLPFVANPIALPSGWIKDYDPNTGIASITIDLTHISFPDTTILCKPASFCTGDSKSCSCALKDTDPTYTPSIFAQCQAACSNWAAKDLDCPDNGCYGFGVNMPDIFSNETHVTPPAPSCFPDTPEWNQGFGASTVNSGVCKYDSSRLPKSDFCSSNPGGGNGQASELRMRP